MIRNIFLTGPRNVGKSTIIKAVLALFDGTIGGFVTLPKLLTNERRVFLMDSFNLEYPKNYIPYICQFGRDGSLEPILRTFDDFGVRILKDALQKEVDLIVMDELGVFESAAKSFQEEVKLCLASSIPVLGVIKAKDTKFLREISDRTDVQVLDITIDNRRQMQNKIQNIILNQLNPIANKERR